MIPKVVIDTNVWVSGIFWKGSNPAKVIDKVDDGKIITHFSSETFREWEEKISKKAFVLDTVEHFFIYRRNLLKLASFVCPKEKVDLCRDPKDNKFLEVAQTASADYLITGDRDLLILKKFGKTRLVTPTQFLKLNF